MSNQLYNNDVAFELQSKKIDENRQGETLTASRPLGVDAIGKKYYIESYGCAMNFSDSEIVASILQKEGFSTTRNAEEADVIMLNTCSIRDKAEQTVRNRLQQFKKQKETNPSLVVGVLGHYETLGFYAGKVALGQVK